MVERFNLLMAHFSEPPFTSPQKNGQPMIRPPVIQGSGRRFAFPRALRTFISALIQRIIGINA